jgi:DNA-binding FadR family transcriptional regulator
MSFKPIDKSRRFLLVSRQLRQAIIKGDYSPGQRLPSERELAEIFGVSRIIVREAIWDLKRSGLVEIKRGAQGGAFIQEVQHDAVTSVMRDVISFTDSRPADIIEVRLIMEPAAAALAAQRATANDIGTMHRHLQTAPDKYTPEFVQWHIGFHRMVARASQNAVYGLLVNILLDFTEDIILGLKPEDRIYHDSTSHPEILEKISQRDAEGAKRLFYNHLLDILPFYEDWEKQFGNHPLGFRVDKDLEAS